MHSLMRNLLKNAITPAIFAMIISPSFLLPSAKMTGHDHNSTIGHKNIGDLISIEKQVCCKDPANTTLLPPTCEICNDFCNTGSLDARHMGHSFNELCRCYPNSECPYYGYMTIDNEQEMQPMLKKPLALTVYIIFISIASQLIVSVVYYFQEKNQVCSYHVKHLSFSFAINIYLNMLNTMKGLYQLPAPFDFKPTGFLMVLANITVNILQLVNNAEIYCFIKCMNNGNIIRSAVYCTKLHKCTYYHQRTWICLILKTISLISVDKYSEKYILSMSIFLEVSDSRFITLLCGFLNLVCSWYMFHMTEMPILDDSAQSVLLKNKISTRNITFKISLIMWIIDVLIFILDSTMESDFIVTQILTFIGSFHGILVSIVLLYRIVFKFFIQTWEIVCRMWKFCTNVNNVDNVDNVNNQDLELAVMTV